MHINYSKIWEDYLLYAILKQVVKNPNSLDKVARQFDCHPEQVVGRSRFRDRHFYAEMEDTGYICYDDERGWLFGWKRNLPIQYWDEVQISKETTVEYEAFVQWMKQDPDIVANTEFHVGMWQKAIDRDLAWSREKVEVGGTAATVSYIVDEEIWRLLRFTDRVCVKKALIEDLLQMDDNHADAIQRFLTDPLFFDSVLSFISFAASSGANIWVESNRGNLDLLIEAFNAAAKLMLCRTIRDCDIKCILTIVGSRIGAFYDYELNIPEVHPVLLVWSLLNRCSIWGPGETFLDMLSQIPFDTWLYPEALVWGTTHDEQSVIAQEILLKLNDGHYHRRYVEVLIAVTVNAEQPFHPDLQEAIMDYLFCKDPGGYAYEEKAFSDLTGSGYMSETARMKVLSLLEMR